MHPPEPAPENAYLDAFVHQVAQSHLHWTGRPLWPEPIPPGQEGDRAYHAPFVLLAHDTESDPRLIYGNLAAQKLFEFSWAELCGMPSRFTAEAPERSERQRLLDTVARQGYIDDYSGIRISRTGKRFRIERATVWNLLDEAGRARGQAALFSRWVPC